MSLAVLHEDADLLVVDKPAGLVCHPSKDGPASSLIGRVRLYLGHGEGRLVNRLDRETSGIVVIAKSSEVAAALGRVFAGRDVLKQYVAVVHGVLEAARVVDSPLGKAERSAVAIKDAVRPDGAAARTWVSPRGVASHAGRPLTVVEARPETGRKHQIRIHLAHIGHPIVGDKIYGDDEQRYLRFVVGALTDADRDALIVDHHALHAQRLAFVWRDRAWSFESALPDRIAALCRPEATA